MSLPRKVREWWNYLRSLNENLEHAEFAWLDALLGQLDEQESRPFKVSSGYDFFVTGVMGYCEFVATASAGEVMDPAYRNPHLVTVQVDMDVPEAELFDSPITLAQICGPDLSTFEMIDLPHPIRIQHDATVNAVFQSRAGFPIAHPAVTSLNVGIALIGERVTTNALSRAMVLGDAEDRARSEARRIRARASEQP